jgi:drug/metabolite transporter (DMT)-like permease
MHQALGPNAVSGELLALGSALFWAIAVILFRVAGRSFPPLSLNLFKTIFCLGLLLVSLGVARQPLFPHYPGAAYGALFLSGIIGIGASDTLFFASLNRLGAGLSAIVNCSYSPLVILLAAAFLSERMNLQQLVGVGLIITAVMIIARGDSMPPPQRKGLLSGIALGLAAMLVMAVSIVIMKPFLAETPVLWATLVRTAGGLLFIGGVFSFHPRRADLAAALRACRNWKPLVSSSFFGGYVAYTIWMGGMKYTSASLAAALNQMSTIFIFFLGVLWLREKATRGKILALGLAVAGVLLITLMR